MKRLIDRIAIGHQLADMRKVNGYTQIDVSNKTGIGLNTIYRIETGRSGLIETIQKLAMFYGASLKLTIEAQSLQSEEKQEVCEWKQLSQNQYKTTCGKKTFCMPFNFCPWCGKPIKED